MPALGITGSVATGKSTFVRQLQRCLTCTVFDADFVARELLENDPAVQNEVVEKFGAALLDKRDQIDRAKLRELVFRSEEQRKRLEEILHPRIRRLWSERATAARNSGEWFVVDIPLLFETGVESVFDVIAVVACSAATQRFRLVSERRLSIEMAERIVASQQSLTSKVARAGYVIWSDAPVKCLQEQAELFAGHLRQRYG